MPSPVDSSLLCGNCPNAGTHRCSRCHNARYCSATCQRADWPLHAKICISFASLPARPGPNFKRALLFRANSPRPRFIWLEHRGSNYNPKLEDWIPCGTGCIDINCYRRLNRRLSNMINLTFDENFLGTYTTPNWSIAGIVGPQYAGRWRGDFIAQGFEGRWQTEHIVARDLDTMALGPIEDCLRFRSQNSMVEYCLPDDVEGEDMT
ncbi:uncharacterized protein BDR25DRAFT_319293 [Lindgomyces ingoldianus]|uniref:Uncharacterized protein n=1 Tax=Lindgomyces ingoldianus TaxID=673940 RepID=A0ACB6QC80_9PLEO|nr:uncharacterized protein BDR25DRAFT_319293 [Lindgomyces ingoldianus]KAF2464213.1 hypothetical protein BDR25DRAFT_319293 [Lindgomyces ingoldianus]